ncbi:MAG: hypothetical protein EKK55_18295 [Rhodocyclaceae bacterium]|nr:MAG: hypothetical protein EKK55_18295 [Rhodocyclaceae bacterium]
MLELPSYCRIAALDDDATSIATARLPEYVGAALRKSGRPRARVAYRIDGIASSAARDVQGDVIAPNALDWRPLLKSGFINDDHGSGPGDLIGYPDRIYSAEVVDEDGVRHPATGVSGYLIDLPRAHEFAQAEAAFRGVRTLGFSVEGPPPVRDPIDRRRIVKATVCHLAATFWPANKTCTARVDALEKSLRKSLGVDDIAALIPEDLGFEAARDRIRRVLPGATDEQCRRILSAAKGRRRR